MQKDIAERSLCRAYYYEQQPPHVDRPRTPITNTNMNIAFSRASCSDSDSGYCADSGSERSHSSPKRDSNSNTKYPDWRAVPKFPQSQSMSALKVRKASPTSGRCRRNEKPLKVRFADVLPDSESSDERFTYPSPRPSPPPLPPPPTSKYYYVTHGSTPKPSNILKFPYPPPYEEAMNRIQFLNEVQGRSQRSSSLGRDCSRRRWQSDDTTSQLQANTSQHFATTNRSFDAANQPFNNALQKRNCCNSMETIVESNFSTFPRNSSGKHCMNNRTTLPVPNPGIMSAGSCDDIVHLESIDISSKSPVKPKFTLCVSSTLQKFASNARRKFGSQDKIISTDLNDNMETINVPVINCKDIARSPGICDPLPDNVRARLVGIDNKGVHVIELQKLENGPFGFYISTGTFKRKKGVYVSRITVRNLHNFLTVGDQIIQIDNVGLKGKTLEQIQIMMTDKENVTLKILPLLSS